MNRSILSKANQPIHTENEIKGQRLKGNFLGDRTNTKEVQVGRNRAEHRICHGDMAYTGTGRFEKEKQVIGCRLIVRPGPNMYKGPAPRKQHVEIPHPPARMTEEGREARRVHSAETATHIRGLRRVPRGEPAWEG
jgi:hypothetical protein